MLTTAALTEGATKMKWEYSSQPTTNLVYNKVSQIFTVLFFLTLLWMPDKLKYFVDKSCVSPSCHATGALLQQLFSHAAPLAPLPLLPSPLRYSHFNAYYPVGFDGHGGPSAGGPICYLTYFSEAQEHQVTRTRSPMSQ